MWVIQNCISPIHFHKEPSYCISLIDDLRTYRLFAHDLAPLRSPREKSKKFAEQASAVVCLRSLGIPEGRMGTENDAWPQKRKMEDKRDAEDKRKKRTVDADGEPDTSSL